MADRSSGGIPMSGPYDREGMSFLLRNLLLGASLVVLCSPAFPSSTPVPAANPYNLQLHELRRAFNSADPLHKLVLLDRIFHLRDYVDDPAEISSILTEIAATSDDDLVRSEAQACLRDTAGLESSSAPNNVQHWYEHEQQRNHFLQQREKSASGSDGLE